MLKVPIFHIIQRPLLKQKLAALHSTIDQTTRWKITLLTQFASLIRSKRKEKIIYLFCMPWWIVFLSFRAQGNEIRFILWHTSLSKTIFIWNDIFSLHESFNARDVTKITLWTLLSTRIEWFGKDIKCIFVILEVWFSKENFLWLHYY